MLVVCPAISSIHWSLRGFWAPAEKMQAGLGYDATGAPTSRRRMSGLNEPPSLPINTSRCEGPLKSTPLPKVCGIWRIQTRPERLRIPVDNAHSAR
jgi:hypothetical protein